MQQLRGRYTLLKAAQKVADHPKGTKGRPRNLRNRGKIAALMTEHMRAAFKAKNTRRRRREGNPVVLRATNEINTATVNEPDTYGFSAINAQSSFYDAEGATESARRS